MSLRTTPNLQIALPFRTRSLTAAPDRWRQKSSWPVWEEFVEAVVAAGTGELLRAIGAGDRGALAVAIDSAFSQLGAGDWARCVRVEVDAWLRGVVLAGYDFLFADPSDDVGSGWILYRQNPPINNVWRRPRLGPVNWYPTHRADTFFYASRCATLAEIAEVTGHKRVFVDQQLRMRRLQIHHRHWPGDVYGRYFDHWDGVVYGPALWMSRLRRCRAGDQLIS